MTTDIFPIYHIGLIQAWFAALLVYRKPNKGAADNLLIIWLLVIGLEMFYSLLNAKYIIWLPDLIIIPYSYGPFLFFYTKLLISRKPSLPNSIFKHFLPIYLFVFISLIWGKPIDIDAVNFMQKGGVTWLAIANFSMFIIAMIYYWRISLVLILKHNKVIGDHFSYRSDSVKLTWLKNSAIWILSGFFMSALTFLFFFTQNIFPFNPIEIFHLGLLIFTFSISYFGIHQPVLYKHQTPRYFKHTDSSEKPSQNFATLLYEHMIQNKPYLINELTIQDLANQLNVSSQEISSYINKELAVNFFTYINGFRIEEAKKRLTNPEYNNETLLGIAFDSGFNSKTSFNTLFKKETGMTPSEFKRNYGRKVKKEES